MTIFCRPVEMLQPAPGGDGEEQEDEALAAVEEAWSEAGPEPVMTQDGLATAALTSRRIRGRGPSLAAAVCHGMEKDMLNKRQCLSV